jgi:Asp/Glu/hydantoin racemase
MKILLVNPNTSASVTARIDAVARAAVSPGTEITALTAPRGVPYIATRGEAVIGAAVALEMLAEHHAGCDAAVIAAFGDPGLYGARELLPIPVVGMAEAAMLTACMLGRRFALVSFASALEPWFRDCVELHGLERRLSGIHMLDGPFRDIGDVQEEKETLLIELCHKAIVAGADTIVLAGAPLAGLAAKVAERVPVPLVDGVAAAVKQAETLASLKPRKATAGSFKRAPKPTTGLSPALKKLLGD